MEDIDQRNNHDLVIDKDAQISVMLNHLGDDSDEIDLFSLFQTMKRKGAYYIWVLLLCFLLGASGGVLAYLVTKTSDTVSSVVTLNYEVPVEDLQGNITDYERVSDLTAPDGEELDLNQITSAYVLQTALKGLELSHPVSLSDLQRNIQISRILSEDSRRQQEVASNMIEDKNNQAYTQVQEIKLTYINRFIVTLTNGFGDEDARVKYNLTNAELQLILDRILDAYNTYLVTTYADLKLPDDEISVIDINNQDILESIDLLRTASTNLTEYCEEKPDSVKAYRSRETGYSLTDLIGFLDLVNRVNVDYLASFVYTNGIVTDRSAMITSYDYKLRDAKTQLAVVNNNISTTKEILDTYKNDEIFVTMQESDTSKSTKTTTDYYNQLITQQSENYEKAAALETTIIDLQDKIQLMNDNQNSSNTEAAMTELQSAIAEMQNIYQMIYRHFQDVMESPFYTNLAEHSSAQNNSKGFLANAGKKIAIGGVLGILIALGLWFMSALGEEMSAGSEEQKKAEEVKQA